MVNFDNKTFYGIYFSYIQSYYLDKNKYIRDIYKY